MTNEIDKAVSHLMNKEEKVLLATLGSASMSFPEDPSRFDQAVPAEPIDISSTAGPLDDLVVLGKSILNRWKKALYDVVCGAEESDAEVRKTILAALKLNSSEGLAAAVTATLIGFFSVGPAVAAIVGVLFGKILLPPVGEEVCSFWKARI